MKLSFWIVLVSGLFIIVSCRDDICPESGMKELEETIADFYRFIENQDTDSRLNLMAGDVILLPDNYAEIRGREKLRKGLKGSENYIFRIRNREIIDMAVRGNTAYTVNKYEYTYHHKDDTADWKPTKNVHLWIIENGKWKLKLDIWNNNPEQ